MPKLRFKVWLLLLSLSVASLQSVATYSQIAVSGSNYEGDGPKIYKSVNLDLIFPKSFNSSENVVSTTIESPTVGTPANTLLSQQQPAIFVTPASVDEAIVTAATTADAAATATAASMSATIPQHIMAATYAMPDNEQQLQQQHIGQQQQHIKQQLMEQEQVEQQQQHQLQQQQTSASTGRAVDYRTAYPFGQLIQPLINNARPLRPAAATGRQRQRPAAPATQMASDVAKIVYPNGFQLQRRPAGRAPYNKYNGQAQIADRFSPSEGVAASHFKHQTSQRVPAASNQVPAYVPPKNLYSFPPNVNANYPSPAEDPKAAVPTNSVSSYLPPASGPLSNGAGFPTQSNGYTYNGPAQSSGYIYNGPPLLPTMADAPKESEDAKQSSLAGGDGDGAGDDDTNDDTIGVLPASAMDAGGDTGDDMAGMDMAAGGADDHQHDHDHHHDHPLTGYDSGKEYPTPPPGWLEEHPDAAAAMPSDHAPQDPPAPEPDHHHDHHHHEHIAYDDHGHDQPFPSFPIAYDHHTYPDIIYDDHFHHHHYPPATLPPETTVAPPPEPAPEPRVKKYSYFYIGRKLWYIPLYFTVWFSFYVLWLILKSIARHKVNLPNHYVSRRSLPVNSTQLRRETLDQLTASVMQKIEDFQKKYIQ